jgi:hypothetical protein
MIDNDLRDLQHSGSLFMLETQSLHSQHDSLTGLSSEDALIDESIGISELVLMASMLISLVKFDSTGSAQVEADITKCMQVCKQTLEKLDGFNTTLEKQPDRPKETRPLITTGTKKTLTINMGKVRNSKVLKKLTKLKEFASNSYSYLQVVCFQCKLQDTDTSEIE